MVSSEKKRQLVTVNMRHGDVDASDVGTELTRDAYGLPGIRYRLGFIPVELEERGQGVRTVGVIVDNQNAYTSVHEKARRQAAFLRYAPSSLLLRNCDIFAKAIERVCNAFRKNADGSWTCMEAVNWSIPGYGQLAALPGWSFKSGDIRSGIDVAAWLTEHCRPNAKQ